MTSGDSLANDFSGQAANVVQAGSIGSVTINAANAAQPFPRPQQLPWPAAHFTNRTAALARLDTLVREPALCLITGMPGVGKTALAVHWGHRVRDEFPDGQLYRDLRGFDPANPVADPGDVLDGFLTALGVPEAGLRGTVDARAALFRTMLDGRRMLVVLDNAFSAEQVRPLLPGTSATVLLTSRNTLPGLNATGVTTVDLDLLTTEDAVSLLREIVGEQRATAEPQALATVARLCGNLPLALRVMAGRIVADPYTPIAELAAELANERLRLDLLDTDDPATAVRPVFTMSYQALTKEQPRVFRLLGLHPGPEISESAACALTGLPAARLRTTLTALVNANLLDMVGARRYRLHDLLRVYAAERAQDEERGDERRRAVHDVVAWYLDTATAAGLALAPHRRPVRVPPAGQPAAFADADAAMAWCLLEQPNLVAATTAAAALGEYAMAWQLPAVLWGFFYRRKPWADWIRTHNVALDSARALGDRYGVATTLGSLGVAHREQREHEKAEECFRQALGIWEELGDRGGQARVCNTYAMLCRERDRRPEALGYVQRALAAWTEIGDQHGRGVAHNHLSGIYREIDQLDEALAHSERATADFVAVGDRHAEAWALHNAAAVHHRLGHPRRAAGLYREALDLRGQLGDRYGQALTLLNLGEVLRELGQTGEADRLLRQALHTFDELGDPLAEKVREKLAD